MQKRSWNLANYKRARLNHRGKMTKDKATGKPKITCRNWECGVVLLASDATSTGQAAAAAADDGMRIFSGVVPVPMAVPGRVYEEGELPWFFAGDN